MNGAVKLKQNKNHNILVFIVHKSLKFHELKMHMHAVSIIAMIISVELFFVSVIIFYEI